MNRSITAAILEAVNSIIRFAVEYLLVDPSRFMDGALWDYAESVFDMLSAAGAGLLAVIFLMGILHEHTSFREMRRPEVLWSLGIRFALAYGAVFHAKDIMVAIIRIMQAVAGAVYDMKPFSGSSFSGVADIPSEVLAEINSLNWFTDMLTVFLLFIGALVMLVGAVTVLLTIFGRFFRIYLHLAVAPFPMAAIGARNTENIAGSFIRSFIACCAEVSLIMLAVILYSVFFRHNVESLSLISETADNHLSLNWIFSSVLNVLILAATVRTCDNILGRWLRV